ncbi:MAG: PepSY-associated TM helix domain-containing protein [Planctomycetota bacterium]
MESRLASTAGAVGASAHHPVARASVRRPANANSGLWPLRKSSGPRPKARRRLPIWVRWLHTYTSLIGFGALIFFAVTGLTLNHAEWFEGIESNDERRGSAPSELLEACSRPMGDLAIAGWIREQEQLSGHLAPSVIDDREVVLAFQGAGYVADVVIERATGSYEVFETRRGAVAIFNDLHKGRHTSNAWKWLIDVSAVVLAASGATGVWLLWFLKRIRLRGLVVVAIGAALILTVYRIWD